VDDLAVRGTAWVSLLGWAASAWLLGRGREAGRRGRAGDAWARAAFTVGVLALALHVAVAFDLRHDWSQASAREEIARQTDAVLGVRSGAGLYVNYAFLAWWAAEAAWWWGRPAAYRARPRALRAAAGGFFLLMFVFGAVVFGQGQGRVLGTLAVLAVLLAWYRGRADRGAVERAHG
jgi:hypothetical protein